MERGARRLGDPRPDADAARRAGGRRAARPHPRRRWRGALPHLRGHGDVRTGGRPLDRHDAYADAAPRHRRRRGRRASLHTRRRTRARLRGDHRQRGLHAVRTALTLLLVLVAGPALAGPREDALAGLADGGDVEVRRRAAATLAEAGTMADVPVLVAALRDADARVRGLAERALWEVWSRSGNEDVDHLLRAGVVEMQHGQLEASIDTFREVDRL